MAYNQQHSRKIWKVTDNMDKLLSQQLARNINIYIKANDGHKKHAHGTEQSIRNYISE